LSETGEVFLAFSRRERYNKPDENLERECEVMLNLAASAVRELRAPVFVSSFSGIRLKKGTPTVE